MSTARSPSNSANQLCQSGLTNTATFTSLISTYQSVFMTNYIIVSTNGSSSSRKKRAVSNTFTCTTLTSIGSPAISSLTAAQLSTLSSGDFYSCETLLGYSANAWSSSQLTALVALAKTVRAIYLVINKYLIINIYLTQISILELQLIFRKLVSLDSII